MRFWSFICDQSIAITIIACVWILGVVAGSKVPGIKTIFIKNPFAGKKSTVIDQSRIDEDPFRYKREYVVNLIVNKKKELPYNDISAFTVRLEDIIENNRLRDFSVENTKKYRKKKVKSSGNDIKEADDIHVSEADLDQIMFINVYNS